MRSRETPRPWTTTKAPSFLAPSFAFLEKNTSCFHMTLTDDIWTNREMLSSLDVFAEWSRITLTHITADWRLQRNQTLQTSWRNYTHHPPKAECLCIFKNLEAKKILHIELSRRRCCCARKRGTLNGGYAHATSASFGPQRRDRATKQRAGNRHVNKKKNTHTRARVLTVNTPTKLEHIKWFIRSDSGHKMFINCRQTAVLVGQQLTVSQTAPYYYW